MSFELFRANGSVSLNDREDCLRLIDEGSVTGTFFQRDLQDDIDMFEYKVTLQRPIDDTVFLFFLQSDFDKITRHRPVEFNANQIDLYFLSSKNITKNYKYFAPFSFDTFSTSTDFGAQIFDGSGNLIYDTRVPECKLKDTFIVGDSGTSSSHVSDSNAWYSLNLFPVDISVVPSEFGSIFVLKSFEQQTSTSVKIDVAAFQAGPNPTTTATAPNVPMVLLDP